MSIILKATKREPGKGLKAKIKEGFVPAVCYGPKTKSVPVFFFLNDFLKVWRKAGESTVISMDIEGGSPLSVLINEVDLDPITDSPRHVDFYVFEKGKKLTVSVPVEFVGVAPAVKELGGILVKVIHEMEVEAEPDKLPHKIEVDITGLKDFNSQILAKDLKVPLGAKLMIEPEEVIVSVVEPKEEVEETPIDISEIEVEKKGKEDDGEDVVEAENKDK